MANIQGIDEKDLVDRFKNGDQSAFEILFKYYYPGLVIYATQFLADYNEAEEIVQDFFVSMWQNQKNLFPSDSLKNYFFTSVKNKSFNFLKHKRIKEAYIHRLIGLTGNHLVYDTDIYVATELQEKITSAIDSLPEKCREVFIMSRFRAMKNEEIAHELELSKRTVETHISHALNILRSELKNYSGLLILLGIIRL